MYTLIVDASAKPVGLTTEPEAVSRIARCGGAESAVVQTLIADPERRYRSQYLDLPAPVIVMAQGYIEIPEVDLHQVNRRVVFARDHYECQYCDYVATGGRALRQLTMDHVKPAHLFPDRFQATRWDNVTTACLACNQKKGGRLPYECGMLPRRTPTVPHYAQLRFAGRLNPEQRDYVQDYFGLSADELWL